MTDPHVRLTVGDEQYAIPVGHVREVAELDAITPVPGAPRTVLGTCNLRGEVLPVFDLARVIGIRQSAAPTSLLVVEHDGSRAGLAVHAVTDIELLDGRSPAESAFVDSTLVVGEQLVGELSIARTFRALRGEIDHA